MRKEKDKIEQELLKAGKMDVDLDADTRTLQSAQDFEDQNQEEYVNFKSSMSSRQQPPEVENNLKNVERKLDDTLLLICEQKIDEIKAFGLPQSAWIEGETLKQTAVRIVKEQLGDDLKVKIYGNAPCGFYKYKYKSSKTDSVGAKVFFYRAGYRSGNVDQKKSSFEWINNAELQSKVRKSYYESVSNMLI
jgi:large subunit ribosomal protein L46